MPRIVILRTSDFGFSEEEIRYAFSEYYPSEGDVEVIEPAELAVEPEGLPPFSIASALVEAAQEEWTHASIYVGLARGIAEQGENRQVIDVAVAALIDKATFTFGLLKDRGIFICWLPFEENEGFVARSHNLLQTLVKTIFEHDTEGGEKLH